MGRMQTQLQTLGACSKANQVEIWEETFQPQQTAVDTVCDDMNGWHLSSFSLNNANNIKHHTKQYLREGREHLITWPRDDYIVHTSLNNDQISSKDIVVNVVVDYNAS